jgi:drug/metabolite transporter (DMT)-like permease
MKNSTAFVFLLAINASLAAGDYLAKAAAIPDEQGPAVPVTWAVVLWLLGCVVWIPVMRAPGFTRLVALSDAMGLVMVALVGRFFLDEHLTARQGVGVALAMSAIWFLGSEK